MSYATRTNHKQDMMHELEWLQEEIERSWLDRSLPDQWTGMEWDAPVDRHKTRVTLRMDSDMLRWFRKLGPGYQARINRVLRVYWTALLCGHIKGYRDDRATPRLQVELQRSMDKLKRGRNPWEDTAEY